MSEYMSTSEYDSDTNGYTIYSSYSEGAIVLTGTASFLDYQRFERAIRAAERLASSEAAQQLGNAVSELIARRLAR